MRCAKLARALATLYKAEIDATGQPMSPAPVAAVENAIDHYRIDENGLIEWANLIIATGFNNLAMNRGILQAARHYISSLEIQEGMLNRVEAVIRSFDPCLSCSTHAVGAMPLVVELRDAGGRLLDRKAR